MGYEHYFVSVVANQGIHVSLQSNYMYLTVIFVSLTEPLGSWFCVL